MIKKNLDDEIITEITGLTEKEINKIKNGLLLLDK